MSLIRKLEHAYWKSSFLAVSSIISNFREDANAALIGTATLWQGIDVPGKSLRSLFIFKMPYKNPNMPIISSRTDDVTQEGGNGFSDYYEPLAILDLKQGMGRLIRSSRDRGVIVILDNNLLNKPRVINSFPDGINIEKGSQEKIIEELRGNSSQ